MDYCQYRFARLAGNHRKGDTGILETRQNVNLIDIPLVHDKFISDLIQIIDLHHRHWVYHSTAGTGTNLALFHTPNCRGGDPLNLPSSRSAARVVDSGNAKVHAQGNRSLILLANVERPVSDVAGVSVAIADPASLQKLWCHQSRDGFLFFHSDSTHHVDQSCD